MIDEITRQRILDRAQIVEVISEFVQLKKRGANYIGLCPFHQEKTPSFTVSESKGIFKCFGCGKAGNVVNFLMEHEKISYVDALRWLAKKYHIEIQEKTLTQEELLQQSERESLFAAIKFAQAFFVEQLHKTDEGKSVGLGYLKQRDVRDDIIEKFALGYSPENTKAFSDVAIKRGFNPEILQKAGLINKGLFDNFAGRITFPIYNLSGNVVGFSGRRLSSNENIAKYFNTPDTDIFHKGQLLFGLFQSKRAIIENDLCYLVEGNLDVLAMHQMGVENAVASLGTSLTQEQILLIKRFTKNVCIVYDSDSAGVKATLRSIDLLLKEGMNVKIVVLPEKHDPDSFSKTVSDIEFRAYLEQNQQDFILYKSGILLHEAKSDPIKRTLAYKEIIRSIALIPDEMIRAIFIKEASVRFNLDEQLLYQELQTQIIRQQKDYSINYIKPEKHTLETPTVPGFVENFYVEEIENELLRIILLYGNEKYQVVYDDITGEEIKSTSVAEVIVYDLLSDDLQFKNLIYRKIFEIIHQQLQEVKQVDVKPLVHNDDEQIREIVANLLSTPYYQGKYSGQSDLLSKYYKRLGIYVKNEKEFLQDLVKQLLLRYKQKILEIAIKEAQQKIEKAQNSEINDEIIQAEFFKIYQLNEVIKQISRMLNLVVR